LVAKTIYSSKKQSKMAQRFLSSIYRRNAYDLSNAAGTPATQGVPVSFSVQGALITPVSGVVACGVTMNSVIEVLPTGLNQPTQKFYTADTVTTLNTAANA
jgi:hypothetical protein